MSQKILFFLFLSFAISLRAISLQVDSLNNLSGQSSIKSDSAQKVAARTAPDSARVRKADPIVYVSNHPFNQNSVFVRDSAFLWRDYRYASDFLNLFPGYFVQSLGTLGQPEELNLYGQGNDEIGIFQDGIKLNYYPNNYFSAYNLSTESIDSIELVPLCRGFLFGDENNAAAVNILSSSRVARQPYTRIRFYQAPDGEGMISVQMHRQAFRKLNIFLEIANRKKDVTFDNTGYSSWNIRTGILYPLRDDLTAGIEYSFTKANMDLWGGVNYDSLQKIYSVGADIVLYDQIKALSVFTELYKKEQSNSGVFKINSTVLNKQPGEFRLYYRENLNEFRLNENEPDSTLKRYAANLTSSTFGVTLSQRLAAAPFAIDLLAGREQAKSNNYAFEGRGARTLSFFTGIVSALFPYSLLTPTFFVKYLNKGGVRYNGIGTDAQFRINNKLSLYSGYSRYEQSVFALSNTVHNLELRVNAEIALQQISITYFKTNPKNQVFLPTLVWNNDRVDTMNTAYGAANITGLNLRLENSYTFLLFEASVNYIKSAAEQKVPEWSGNIGFYYKAIHFDSALHLKAGFDFQFFTKFKGRQYDLFFEHAYTTQTAATAVPANYSLSFTVVGEIQHTAIVYFTWENLTDNMYYVVPYFPMTRRGLRFGLAWDLFN